MQGFSGYNVQYSPYFDNKLAVASASNYGLVGNGRLSILDIAPNGQLIETKSFLTQDCLFDIAWNEQHEKQVVVAQGDGSLRLFDIDLAKYPIAIFNEHKKEVMSCNWNLINKTMFTSSSWDGTVKIWSPTRKESLLTLRPTPKWKKHLDSMEPIIPKRRNNIQIQPSHKINMPNNNNNKDCIYQSQFSPHDPNLLICCSGDSYTTIFDLRDPYNTQRNFLSHAGMEVLSADFNKYRPNVLATAGVDNSIRIWDFRMLVARDAAICINEIVNAHDLAVRKVVWSPHHSDILLSTSYDMSCKIWNDLSYDPIQQRKTGKTNSLDFTGNGCRFIMNQHTEFVFGADWSMWGQPGYVASTGWDGNVFIWNGLRG